MTTRLRSANLEQESANTEEGVGDLSVEEKYVEVKQLIALGKEKGFLLYDEIYEVLPEEVTSLPEELDEIYIRFNDLGIDVVEDAEKQLSATSSKALVTIENPDIKDDPDQIVSEFRQRYFDTQIFFDPFAGGKFANYLFDAHRKSNEPYTAESSRYLMDEAQLFIDAAHSCNNRLGTLVAV